MTTEHDEENRRGGLRGAVDELFGRGDNNARDERAENVHRDDAHAQDSTLDREPGATTELGDTHTQSQSRYEGGLPTDDAQRQTYGDEARGATAVPEQVQRSAETRGAETRGDADLSGQSRYDDARHDGPRYDDDERGVHGDVTGSVSGDVRHDDAAVDDAAAGTGTYSQATPAAPATPAASATTAATATHDTGGGHDTGTTNMAAADNSDAEGRAALVAADRAESYSSRWNDVKGEFVDEPRRAVADADALVGELLDELQELFKAQRADIEHSLDADETSTEDLRLALRRYRSFFDRLLSI